MKAEFRAVKATNAKLEADLTAVKAANAKLEAALALRVGEISDLNEELATCDGLGGSALTDPPTQKSAEAYINKVWARGRRAMRC